MAFLGDDTVMAMADSVVPAGRGIISSAAPAAPVQAQAVAAGPAPLVPAKLSLMDKIKANPGKAALIVGGALLAGWWLLRKKPAAQG